MDEYNVRKKIHADSDWQAVAWRYGIKHPMEQALKKKYVECNINWMREKRVSPAAAVARAPFPTRRAVREAEKLLMESANMPKIVLEAIVNEGLSREQALATYGVDDDFLRLFDSQYLPPDAYRKCIAGTPCNAIVLSDERQDVRLTLQRIAIGNYIRNLDQLPRYSDIDLVADKLGVDNPELRLHFRKALIWRAFDKVRLGASVGDVAAELDISEPTLEKHVASWRETLRKDHLSAKRWQELLSSDLFDVASAEHSFEQAFTAAAKKLLNDLCGNTDLTSLAVIADVAENVVEGSSRNVTL
ncbi:hypothetical protein NL30_36940 [Burkholderia contaminans]|uniref:hypothetical protein n=1 Tax=Burkholderia contaminans TaxID=488447 RepID=UPI00064A2E05|nr:hypothetical protein [Burkholderia contaminans]AKM45420.1 hypothetical protein NL30_36940 [Burkholderia contaminans]